MSYIIKCDRCGKKDEPQEQRNYLPKRWSGIALSVKARGCTWAKWHQFCPECAEHLGLGNEPPAEETSAEKLVAILESMVDAAVNERDT